MRRMVPLSKQSKKAQKEFHNKQRASCNGFARVTRAVPNGRAYDRNRINRETRTD